MNSKIINIDAKEIADWDSFHLLFRTALGFPEWYGSNQDAWIDCMGHLRDPSSGMTSVSIGIDEIVALCINNADDFQKRCPVQFKALLDCSTIVNKGYLSAGERPALSLILL